MWQAHGYSGSDQVANLIDSLQGKTAVICGNAQGVFDEYKEVIRGIETPVIFAVNDVGMYLPKVDAWVSYHSDKLKEWSQLKLTGTIHEKTWTLHTGGTRGATADVSWYGTEPTLFPLSGQFAFQIAFLMGAERIILCGCPMDETPRFFEPTPRADGFKYGRGQTESDRAVRETMEREFKRLPQFRAKIRSMSGWSRTYFGPVEGLNHGRSDANHSRIPGQVESLGRDVH